MAEIFQEGFHVAVHSQGLSHSDGSKLLGHKIVDSEHMLKPHDCSLDEKIRYSLIRKINNHAFHPQMSL